MHGLLRAHAAAACSRYKKPNRLPTQEPLPIHNSQCPPLYPQTYIFEICTYICNIPSVVAAILPRILHHQPGAPTSWAPIHVPQGQLRHVTPTHAVSLAFTEFVYDACCVKHAVVSGLEGRILCVLPLLSGALGHGRARDGALPTRSALSGMGDRVRVGREVACASGPIARKRGVLFDPGRLWASGIGQSL